jgi:hypothetical protein
MQLLPDDIDLPRRTTLVLLAGWLSGCGGGGGAGSESTSSSSSGTSGTGTSTTSSAALGAVAAAVAGSNQSVALRAAVVAPLVPTYSALLCGDNTWGQMGNGTLTTPQTKLTQVATSTTAAATWKAVAAGGLHTLAIKSDGTLWAWGLNLNGQLGTGVSGGTYRASPMQIGTAKDWLAVAAGESHSLAQSGTATTQSLYSWGQNTSGQLGLGNTLSKSVPTKITATATFKAPWVALSANSSYSLVLQSDGTFILGVTTPTGNWASLARPRRWFPLPPCRRGSPRLRFLPAVHTRWRFRRTGL